MLNNNAQIVPAYDQPAEQSRLSTTKPKQSNSKHFSIFSYRLVIVKVDTMSNPGYVDDEQGVYQNLKTNVRQCFQHCLRIYFD